MQINVNTINRKIFTLPQYHLIVYMNLKKDYWN